MIKRLFYILLLVISLCTVVKAELPDVTPYSGDGLLVLTAKPKTDGAASYSTWHGNVSNVTKNCQYNVSFWMKGDTDVKTSFRIVGKDSWNSVKLQKDFYGTTDWVKKEFTFNAEDFNSLSYAFLDASTKAGNLYIDELAITPADSLIPDVSAEYPGFEAAGRVTGYGTIQVPEPSAVIPNAIKLFNNTTRIQKLQTGELTVSLDFLNYGGYYSNTVFIAALFQDNVLEQVAYESGENILKNAIYPFSCEINVDRVDENTEIKVMLFDSLSNIKPVCNGYSKITGVEIVNNLNLIKITGSFRRGVNIAGAEFGSGIGVMNTDYTYNTEATFKYFAEKGMDIIRVPVKWERLQNSLNGELNIQNLSALKQNIAWAKKYNAQVIIDIHNYGGRDGVKFGQTISSSQTVLTKEHFLDFWLRLSDEFKNESGIYAYDLMNEPNGISAALWKDISQACLSAIRNNSDNTLIMVEGVYYSNADGWQSKNEAANGGWITDPVNNYIYSAHCYFDGDNSGEYKKTVYEEGGVAKLIMRSINRLNSFTDWCEKFGERGYIGEFGVPDYNIDNKNKWPLVDEADTRDFQNDGDLWLQVLEPFMAAMDEASVDATYWAAGEWWNGYPLSVQKGKTGIEAKQLPILLQHLSFTK